MISSPRSTCGHTGRSVLATLLAVAASTLLGGCTPIVSFLFAAFAPPEEVPARYSPPKDSVMVVLVDDYYQRATEYGAITSLLARELADQMLSHDVVDQIVPCDEVEDLAISTNQFQHMRISQIGQALDADAVLYVIIDEFSLKDNPSSSFWQGRLQVTVRVVDAATSENLWPHDRPDGFPVRTVELDPEDRPSPDYALVVSEQLAEKMADRVVRLFYEHEMPRDLYSESNEP